MNRIRIVGGPWPERIGAEGVIVNKPKYYNRYPFYRLPKTHVIVLLDDDPLVCCPASPPDEPPWTCCIERKDVEAI